MTCNEKLLKALGWITTIIVPLFLLMISIRLLITPVFPQIEYRLPGFPEDSYGFTLDDRLKWSAPSIRYLVNFEGIDYLEALAFDDGTPIYNTRELSHMEDVKAVVTGMRIGLIFSVLFVGLYAFVSIKCDRKDFLKTALMRGSWAHIGLISAILLFVAISFDDLFTWFHKIFFESGTWQFFMSDTLIRLFPLRFWQDAFIYVGVLSLLFSGLILFLSKKIWQKE